MAGAKAAVDPSILNLFYERIWSFLGISRFFSAWNDDNIKSNINRCNYEDNSDNKKQQY